MDEIIALEQAQAKGKYKVRNGTLKEMLCQLHKELEYVSKALDYKESHNINHKLVQVVHKSKAIQLPSNNVLSILKAEISHFIPLVKSLNESNIKGIKNERFTYHDVQWNAYKQIPENTIKQGGHYDNNGYHTYLNVYIKKKEWHKCPTKSDSKGFYYELGSKKHYYYKFKSDYGTLQESSEESPEESTSTQLKSKPKPKTKTKRKAKEQPRPKQGSSKKIVTSGHGLELLLAQAKDPPGIEISGEPEVIKSHRRRAKKHPDVKSVSGLFHWFGVKDACFIILFKSVEARQKYLEKKTKSKIKLRLCNFT